MKVCHFLDDFSNAFVTKRQTDRLRREAFGVRRIPALCESSARREAKAPEYRALQTLRAIWLRLGRAEDRRALPPGMICGHVFITQSGRGRRPFGPDGWQTAGL